MTAHTEFDVVIAGTGMVGAAAACLFARHGRRVALLPTRPPGGDSGGETAGQTDERVSAISLATVNLLRALEVWPALADRAAEYRAMRVWDADSAARIGFDAAELGRPCLGYIIENRDVVAALLAKLRQNYTVRVFEPGEIIDIQGGDGEADDQRIDTPDTPLKITYATHPPGGDTNTPLHAHLLIAADGANSSVRARCGIPAPSIDYAQDAITATITTERPHRDTAWQCFADGGVAAMLPRADRRCALVWSCPRRSAEQLAALPEAEFAARLQPLFAAELGAITACGTRRRHPLARHHAARYLADRVALIGDAAHRIHPLAGLGANLGLLDAAALDQVIADAERRGIPPGQHSVLRRYERWRRGENQAVLWAMTALNQLFAGTNPAAKIARASGMNLVAAITPLKTALAEVATGVRGDLPTLCSDSDAGGDSLA